MSGDARVAGGILWIDLGAIAANWRSLAARVRPAECAAVIKADGYGLGALRVMPALLAAGCRTFFVATVEEGQALTRLRTPGGGEGEGGGGEGRSGGEGEGGRGEGGGGRPAPPDPIALYVLNGLFPGSEAEFVGHDLAPVLNSLADVDRWAAYARRRERPLPAALHLDTGMSRLGLDPAELAILAADPGRLRGIRLTLIMSHLACADEPAHPLNALQFARFRAALTRLPPAPASLANSGGIFLGPPYHGQLVRPGVALYGGAPQVGGQAAPPNPMRPVIRLDARILQVREIDAGTTVGYGATHKSPGPARIATVGIGYADGFLRSLSNRAHGYIGSHPAPLVGRVSMDLTCFDVTRVPEGEARPGAFIELIGPNRPLDRVADEAGTISYEILTQLGRRYHRVYAGNGR